jgi:hypothetical protein
MPAVSAAEFRGSALDNQNSRATLSRAERRAQSRITAAQHQNVENR